MYLSSCEPLDPCVAGLVDHSDRASPRPASMAPAIAPLEQTIFSFGSFTLGLSARSVGRWDASGADGTAYILTTTLAPSL